MARIAVVWELGNSLGHATSTARLGEALQKRGHSVSLFLRETGALRYLPEARSLEVFASPAIPEAPTAFAPSTYPHILAGSGYRDAETLSPLFNGWREHFARVKPDLVITDFGPTALLAARALGIRRATYGNGFFTPPRLTPLPPFRIEAPVEAQKSAADEAYVLGVVNEVLVRSKSGPLECLAQQFESDEDFLCTFPELDHYGTRPASGYWGPRISTDGGRIVDWPEGNGKRVLVYLPATVPCLDELFATLKARGHCVIAFIPGLEPARRAAYASSRIRMTETLVRLDRLLPACDLLVSMGGEIGPGSLAHGVPLLLLPQHYEQLLTALRVELMGAGIGIRNAGESIALAARTGVAAPLDRILQDPSFTQAARNFAARYKGWSPAEQRRRVLARIEELVAS
ncbi:hypothetical protein BWI17_10835 [Betaproteobacteria bacterium GR16-43]|nr:hypothetical protein BWI17_10835 [Betaproteobacteria bacterium GR16-43]